MRVPQKPASLYSMASAMGCFSLWSPWDFITQRQMDEPGTSEFRNREGRFGVEGQAISLLTGSMPQVACKHAMRRPGERQCTTKEMAHLSLSGNYKLWQRIKPGKVDFSSMATTNSEWEPTYNNDFLFIFPATGDF